MDIALLIFDRLTALDAIGPYEVLQRLPGAQVKFVAAERGPVRTEQDMLGLVADFALRRGHERRHPRRARRHRHAPARGGRADARVDPRASTRAARGRRRCAPARCCSARPDCCEGKKATTHWARARLLRQFGATPTSERVVEQGKIITAAGVSSGIDMALTLAAHVAGDEVAQAIQLGIEYDPQPPFDSGSVAKASERDPQARPRRPQPRGRRQALTNSANRRR